MRKKFLFLSLIILAVFFASFVYAEESGTASISAEDVKCIFENSDAEQKCYTADGLFSCSGTGGCKVNVSGIKGDRLTWKSSCGGYAYTTMDGLGDYDGHGDYAWFDCAGSVSQQIKCVFDGSKIEQKCYTSEGQFLCSGLDSCTAEVSGLNLSSQGWKSSCGGGYLTSGGLNNESETIVFDCVKPVIEQVKCVFKGSQTEQRCYTAEDNNLGCSDDEACVVDVKEGVKGDNITWKSSCGGYVSTIINGQNKYVEFDCTTPVSEKVKCVFEGSQTEQRCYTAEDNNVGCSGKGTCVVDVAGIKGDKLTWKSSCGGYVYTTMDGLGDYDGHGEYAEFNCSAPSTSNELNSIKSISINADDIVNFSFSEIVGACLQIKDSQGNYFSLNSSSYAYSCANSELISGYELEMNIPNSSFNKSIEIGKSYQICNYSTDGNNACSQSVRVVNGGIKEKVKCVFEGSQTEQRCYTAEDNNVGCSGKGTCVVDVAGIKGDRLTWKSSCGGYVYTTMDGLGDYDGHGEYVEFNCSPEIVDINNDAKDIYNNKYENILFELKQLRDTVKEQQNEIKYLKSLTGDLKKVSEKIKSAINDFITYGVDANTVKLGAGERAAVISSYKEAFAKLPETESELADVIKIANGRFPSVASDKVEKAAKEQFVKIYKRIPDLKDAEDNAAIKVMAYGLKQKAGNRNLNSEKSGIKTFKAIYGYTPKSTKDWNIMQAITYSGAAREKDTDGDLLSDKMEAQYGTDKNKIDTDGDGFKDGVEVNSGFNPKGKEKL
ncbi:MAG: hypothetical protein PHF50_03065 [Patescibacteria group bacterium]|nr:hypothetical protein [Patescibacteria group bacterium]